MSILQSQPGMAALSFDPTASFVERPQRVAAVRPVAFRIAAHMTPNPDGGGTVLDAMLAQIEADPVRRIAFEYAVEIKRADLISGEDGMNPALADALLAAAAQLPDAHPVWEAISDDP